jgi:hypothetical protein
MIPMTDPAPAGPESTEPANPTGASDSAEPPVLARALAFVSILLAGAAGGFIGWAFVDLQCEGDCTVTAGIVGLVSALGAALGVGIVAVLALRALGEWQIQQTRGTGRERDPGLVARRQVRPASDDRPPRVR